MKTNIRLEYINYVDLSDDYSHQVWECRNRDEIRMYMTNPDKFSFETHQHFVQSLNNDKNKLYVAFFSEGKFVASYDLVNIKYGISAERGLFINPEYQRMGIGNCVESIMVNFARDNYHLKMLKADVLKNNYRSVEYHKSVGYEIATEDDKYFYMEKTI